MFNGEDFVASFANSCGVFCHFMFKDILEESYDEYIYIYIYSYCLLFFAI